MKTMRAETEAAGWSAETDYRTAFSRPISSKEFDHKGHLKAVANLRKASGLEQGQIYQYLGWNDAPLHFRGRKHNAKSWRWLNHLIPCKGWEVAR